MNEENRCQQCGAALPANAPQGLCPGCLLKRGLDTLTEASQADSRAAAAECEPPTPEEMADFFPDLEILELVGRGGMGVVYKARQKRLDRLVALKILSPQIAQDSAFSERFAREARAMAMLSHANIVAVHDFGQTRLGESGIGDRDSGNAFSPTPESRIPSPQSPLYYFLMEFIDGVNLRRLLDTGKLAPEEALAIVPQICDALQYAHDHGVVHRDIKPENILLDKQGQVKIADFGIAKLVGAGRGKGDSPHLCEAPGGPSRQMGTVPFSLTAAGQIIGTPQYMAPEQLETPQKVDHRADIYSLGVVFYQMLTGELPTGRFAPPSKKVEIDVRLDEVVLRALEKEPERRYQQASEVKTEVENIATTPRVRDDYKIHTPDPQSPSTGGPWQWADTIAMLAGMTFTSSQARWFANASALGFLGFLSFLASIPLPGMRWCLGFSGFSGFFGLISVAFIIEYVARHSARRNAGAKTASESGSRRDWRAWVMGVGIRDGKKVINWPGLILGWPLVFAGCCVLWLLTPERETHLITFLIFAVTSAAVVAFFAWVQSHRSVEQLPVLESPRARKPQSEVDDSSVEEARRRKGKNPAITALALCIVALPAALLADLFTDGDWMMGFVGFVGLELIALFLGIIGWKYRTGKAAIVVSVGLLLVLSPLLLHWTLSAHRHPLLLYYGWLGSNSQSNLSSMPRQQWQAATTSVGPGIHRVSIEGRQATIEGEASTKSRIMFAAGGGYVSCGFKKKGRFTAVIKASSWRYGLDITVVDADGNRLLTSHTDGLGTAYFPPDRVVFGDSLLKPAADGAIKIAEVHRQNGERLPLTVRLSTIQPPTPKVGEESSFSDETNAPAPDMQAYLNKTQQLVRQRKYKEALERFVWFHDHALEHDQGMTGVRLSFALSYWKNLGDVYPPAKKALMDTRDRKTLQLREGKGYAALFHDVAGLNRTLDDNAATVRLFRELDKSHPELAGRCWHFAKDEVFKQKQYDLAKKYIKDPLSEFDRVKAGYDIDVGLYSDPRIGRPEFKQWNENHFVEECLNLIELATVNGDKKAAEEIRRRAASVVDDPRLQKTDQK